jgi:hypothetical protein
MVVVAIANFNLSTNHVHAQIRRIGDTVVGKGSITTALTGTRSATTPPQTGWYAVSTDSFSSHKSEGYIRSCTDLNPGNPSPDMGAGYVWTDVPVSLGALNIPKGSVIISARLDYKWGPIPPLNDHSPYVTKAAWRFTGGCQPTGQTDEPYIATDFQPAQQYFINWIMIDGVARWFHCCPPPNRASGSIDLLAAGFGPYIKANSSFVVGGNMQVGFKPGRVFVHTSGWHQHNLHYAVSVRLPNSLSATLTVQYALR